jgi:hypothetical protein
VFKRLFEFLPRFWSNWITLLGTALTTVAASTILFIFAATLFADFSNIYAYALGFMIMPGLFIAGLMIIAVGFLWERRRKKKHPEADPIQQAFVLAFRDPRARRLILFVSIATLVNIVIVGAAGNKALVYMDSPEFCGKLCHGVMQPEYDTYLESPHSRIACVTCHIGPGASWAVKAKVDGLRQVLGVMTGNFSRPIPSPVHSLRPARDTCEQCHWPAKFHGNRISFHVHFGDDEENTPEVTALALRVGGKREGTGQFHGIHWHVSPELKVEYEALDDKRERIGKVRVYKDGELTAEYLPPEGSEGVASEVRTMDCVDCHNRPTHVYDQNATLAVDRVLLSGALDWKVPFLRLAATSILEAAGNDLDRDGAAAHFSDALGAWYDKEQPDARPDDETLATAAETITGLYLRNIYPDMDLVWGTHPNHLGHLGEEKDLRGCFRCHNDQHATADGEKTISQDCELCHEFLAEEESPDDLSDELRSLFSLSD